MEVDHEKVKNVYESDMSVSFEGLGFPSEPSGIFLEAYEKAAKALTKLLKEARELLKLFEHSCQDRIIGCADYPSIIQTYEPARIRT